jgi:hypothetical protein
MFSLSSKKYLQQILQGFYSFSKAAAGIPKLHLPILPFFQNKK